MEDILEKIKVYADHAHGEQKRKYTKERYIVHPIRVMKICKEYTNELPILAAALLHDVLEDTPVSEDDMLNFLTTVMNREDTLRTLNLVIGLTDVFTKENHPNLNRRERKKREFHRLSKTPPNVQTIKYADIIDNSLDICSNDPDFARVFLKEAETMLKTMGKGNQDLYIKAVNVVSGSISKIMSQGNC